MSHICELRLVVEYQDMVGCNHSKVFWNYASYMDSSSKIQEMREFARQKSKENTKVNISFERITRKGPVYYWRVLNKFHNGKDLEG